MLPKAADGSGRMRSAAARNVRPQLSSTPEQPKGGSPDPGKTGCAVAGPAGFGPQRADAAAASAAAGISTGGVDAMGINVVDQIDDWVAVKTVLVSVSDKSGLDHLIPELLAVSKNLHILSTGGTYARIQEMLGDRANGVLTQVSDYTGQPETQGGLVKTLDFKIHLGLLTETYNPAHQSDLQRTAAVPIDMVVVNLYPFGETVARADVTAEAARGNIDIGGPCMIRAAAKNFIRVAPVVDPEDYGSIVSALKQHEGRLSLETRYQLARKAFAHTAAYDGAIAAYLQELPFDAVRRCYRDATAQA